MQPGFTLTTDILLVSSRFDVYVPRYGHEARLLTADMPCSAAWNAAAKCAPPLRRVSLAPDVPRRHRALPLPRPCCHVPNRFEPLLDLLPDICSCLLRCRTLTLAPSSPFRRPGSAGNGAGAAAPASSAAAAPSNEGGLPPLPLPAQVKLLFSLRGSTFDNVLKGKAPG